MAMTRAREEAELQEARLQWCTGLQQLGPRPSTPSPTPTPGATPTTASSATRWGKVGRMGKHARLLVERLLLLLLPLEKALRPRAAAEGRLKLKQIGRDAVLLLRKSVVFGFCLQTGLPSQMSRNVSALINHSCAGGGNQLFIEDVVKGRAQVPQEFCHPLIRCLQLHRAYTRAQRKQPVRVALEGANNLTSNRLPLHSPRGVHLGKTSHPISCRLGTTRALTEAGPPSQQVNSRTLRVLERAGVKPHTRHGCFEGLSPATSFRSFDKLEQRCTWRPRLLGYWNVKQRSTLQVAMIVAQRRRRDTRALGGGRLGAFGTRRPTTLCASCVASRIHTAAWNTYHVQPLQQACQQAPAQAAGLQFRLRPSREPQVPPLVQLSLSKAAINSMSPASSTLRQRMFSGSNGHGSRTQRSHQAAQ